MSSYDGEHINLQLRRVIDEVGTAGEEIVTPINQATAAFVASMWDLLKSHAHYSRISTEPEFNSFGICGTHVITTVAGTSRNSNIRRVDGTKCLQCGIATRLCSKAF